MKINRYLYFAGAAAMFAACSDEALETAPVASSLNKNLGEIIEAPMLGVTSAFDQEGTRAYDASGNWKWTPTTSGTIVKDVERIGLCWTGVNPGGLHAKDVTGDDVYTNFEFLNVGWLYEGEDDPSIHCGALNNGDYNRYDDELTPKATLAADVYTASVAGKTLDFTKGLFRTYNSTIYAGEYVIYSPFNQEFFDKPVTAIQDRIMTVELNSSKEIDDMYQLYSEYGFSAGIANLEKGGSTTNKFALKPVSSRLHLYLSTVSGTAEIKEIVLFTKGQKDGLVTSQQLSAAKIKAAGASYTKDILLENADKETCSTYVVKTNDGTDYLTVGTTVQELYIPVLPTTVNDLQLLIVKKDNTTAVVALKDIYTNMESSYEFKSGKGKAVKLQISASAVLAKVDDTGATKSFKFKSEYFAYDEESFEAAYSKAWAASTSTKAGIVTLLDDVELTSQEADYAAEDASKLGVNVMSDPNFAPTEKSEITLAGNAAAAIDYNFAQTNFDTDVTTNPMGCCNQGKVNLTLNNATTAKNTVLTVNGGKLTLNHAIAFNGDVNSVYEQKDEEGAYHTSNIPSVFVNETADVKVYANFVNEGDMLVPCKVTYGPGKIEFVGGDLVNKAPAGTRAADDARATVTVKGNGNSGEDGIIIMSKNGANEASIDNYGDIFNMGNIDNNSAKGTFKNEAYATFTDYVGSSLSGYRLENMDVTSEFISEVNSLVRYNNAIDPEGIRPTTTVRFVYSTAKNIGAGTFVDTYELIPNTDADNGIHVPYTLTPGQLVKFESCMGDNPLTIKNAVDSEGNAIAVETGSWNVRNQAITLDHEALKINGDYAATKGEYEGAPVEAANTWFKQGVEITGNATFSTTGNVRLNTEETLKVGGNIVAEKIGGSFNFNEKSEVIAGGDINIVVATGGTNFENATKVTAKNMSVAAGNNVKFEKNNVTYLGKGDSANGKITNEGTINIVNAVSGSDVAAKVWVNSRAGAGTYQNNSYPQYY